MVLVKAGKAIASGYTQTRKCVARLQGDNGQSPACTSAVMTANARGIMT